MFTSLLYFLAIAFLIFGALTGNPIAVGMGIIGVVVIGVASRPN